MSRTEAILAAVAAELRHRRRAIDGGNGLMSLTINVKMDSRAGRPREVWVRPEWKERVIQQTTREMQASGRYATF